MSPVAIIIWIVFIAIFGAIYWNKIKGKKKYEGVQFNNDPNWMEKSIAAYPQDEDKKYYFFHYDKELLNQGHVIEDEQHNVVYEIKFLYNNGLADDEVDFVNHIINKTYHHQIGKTKTTKFSSDGSGIVLNSTFTFDGEEIFGYLQEKGYDFKFNVNIASLSYRISIFKEEQEVGTIYSSNNGKNLYERTTEEVEEKMGGKGLLVLKSEYSDLDAVILYALAFTRTELDAFQLKH